MERLEFVLLAGAAPALVMLLHAALKLRGGLLSPTVWAAVFCGTGVCLPALALELGGGALRGLLHLSPVAWNAVLMFGIVGPAEEGMKLVIILALVQFDGPQPARRALYASIGVGVGFALLENMYYLVHAHNMLVVAILRANTAIPVHLMLAMALGAMVVRSRVYPETAGLLLFFGFALAALLHGAYDFLLTDPFGDVLVSRRLIQFGGLLAIGAFTRVLPLAAQADADRGEEWPPPLRIGCFCAGLLALPWPVVTFLFALQTHQPGARIIAVFPSLIVADLIRSAFARAKPRSAFRVLMRA